MCSGPACIGLIAAALVTLPGAAMAQSSAQLRQRIDVLERAFARSNAALARADSTRRETIPVDSMRAGSLRVIATRGVAPTVRAVIDHAWRILDETYGDAAAVLARSPLYIQVVNSTDEIVPAPPADPALRGVNLNTILPVGSDTSVVLRSLLFQSSLTLGAWRDTALTGWLRVNFTPVWPRDDRLQLSYIDLVTSPWSHARACYLGDLVSCRAALGLIRGADPVLLWFDAPDRRRLVRDLPYSSVERGAQVQYQRCLNNGPDEDCVAALHGNRFYNLEPALESPARLSIMQAALLAGGRHAYDRLLASVGRPMDQRLALAADVSPDSLLSRWRSTVLAARPKTVEFGSRQAWAALLWGVLFGVIALKSTRWR